MVDWVLRVPASIPDQKYRFHPKHTCFFPVIGVFFFLFSPKFEKKLSLDSFKLKKYDFKNPQALKFTSRRTWNCMFQVDKGDYLTLISSDKTKKTNNEPQIKHLTLTNHLIHDDSLVSAKQSSVWTTNKHGHVREMLKAKLEWRRQLKIQREQNLHKFYIVHFPNDYLFVFCIFFYMLNAKWIR